MLTKTYSDRVVGANKPITPTTWFENLILPTKLIVVFLIGTIQGFSSCQIKIVIILQTKKLHYLNTMNFKNS